MREVARYLGVQVVAYGIDYGAYALVYFAGGNALAANIVGKVLAGAFAFLAHRAFTFRSSDGPVGTQLVRYAGLLALNIPLSSACLYVLMAWLPPLVAKVVADVACVAVTYALSRSLVFVRGGDRR